MTQVTAYKATDGQLFEGQREYQAHQAKLDFAAWYENNQLYGIYEGSRVETRVMLDWLQENRDKVAELLQLRPL